MLRALSTSIAKSGGTHCKSTPTTSSAASYQASLFNTADVYLPIHLLPPNPLLLLLPFQPVANCNTPTNHQHPSFQQPFIWQIFCSASILRFHCLTLPAKSGARHGRIHVGRVQPLLPTPKPTYPTTNQPHSTLTTHLSLTDRSHIHYSQGNAMTSGRILHLALHATSGTKRRRSRDRQTRGTRRHRIKRFNRREAAAG